MNIVFLDSKDWQKVGESRKQEIEETIERAARSAADALGDLLGKHVNVLVHPELSTNVIPETGEGGWTHNSELVRLYFDPNFPNGYKKYLKQLASTAHHELHHAARYHSGPYDDRLIAAAINEGMATVFERDISGSRPLWSEYGPDETMNAWYKELIQADRDWSEWNKLAFDHPDGRRWIAYKTGTWIIDKALEDSQTDLYALTSSTVDDILRLAKLI